MKPSHLLLNQIPRNSYLMNTLNIIRFVANKSNLVCYSSDRVGGYGKKDRLSRTKSLESIENGLHNAKVTFLSRTRRNSQMYHQTSISRQKVSFTTHSKDCNCVWKQRRDYLKLILAWKKRLSGTECWRHSEVIIVRWRIFSPLKAADK